MRHTYLAYICCKVKSWTAPERNVILLDQNSASVWNIKVIHNSIILYSFDHDLLLLLIIALEIWASLLPLFSILWILHVFNSFSSFLLLF
jgi:hypothetical protein